MAYNIYQDDEKIATIDTKEYEVTGLKPNTSYSFSVSEVIGDKEAEKSEPVTVTTKHSVVASVAVSPKTNNLETGATRQLNETVEASTAKHDGTNKYDNESCTKVDTIGFCYA